MLKETLISTENLVYIRDLKRIYSFLGILVIVLTEIKNKRFGSLREEKDSLRWWKSPPVLNFQLGGLHYEGIGQK